jgi:DNA-directed RNA polymerase subunit M
MTIEFCPKCGKILIPKKDNQKIISKCSHCNFEKLGKGLIGKNKIKKEPQKGKGIIRDENAFADYKHECSKCGYNKAQIIDMGVFYSDEDNLILLKCGKCGHSERIGRKTS